MQTATFLALALYFVAMLFIGLYAWARSTSDSAGYLLAGRNLPPAVAALSAGASDMSGWLLMGLPGALYAAGLVEAWIGIGLFVGALANWLVVAPQLRAQTESCGNALTIPEFLANRFPERANALRLVSALVIVVFFALYSAAGLVAGGKLFETAFAGIGASAGMSDYQFGLWLTALVVLAYTMIGGFLAVSLTDFVQGLIMLAALVVMPLAVLFGPEQGGGMALLRAVDQPGFLSLTHGLGAIGFLSAVTWGLGYFGQPHIIVRFMAVRSVDQIARARNIALSWMALCLIGAVLVGIAGRAYVEAKGLALADPETIFIVLAQRLFTPFVAGLLLAALLAAVMSTISSQLLVASSSLTEDFYRLLFRREASEAEAVRVGRLSTAAVALIALYIASDPQSGVLALVSNAWAGFGAAFGPLVILALHSKRMTGTGALAGLIVGALTVIGWIALGWNKDFFGLGGIYEIIPGFIAAWAGIELASRGSAPQRSAQSAPRAAPESAE